MQGERRKCDELGKGNGYLSIGNRGRLVGMGFYEFKLISFVNYFMKNIKK